MACFAAYTAAYISRCNLAPSLDAIAKAFDVNAMQVGLLPTCFAIPYAAGQIVSGALADRCSGSRLMGIGLMGSALVNILFSFSDWFPLLLVFWWVNGMLQSMIWTPIVHLLAIHFRQEVRDHAAFFLSLTLIAGYLIAWALSGWLTSLLSWRVAFLVSGLITAAVAIPSVLRIRRARGSWRVRPAEGDAPRAPVRDLMLHTGLPLLLLGCLANGYVRDGIANWATKLLMDTQGIDLGSAVGIILILPAVNFLGIRLGQGMYGKNRNNPYRASGILFAICTAVCCLLPTSIIHLAPLAAALVAASAMMYGLNPLLTTLMPMQFSRMNRVALTAGLMDAMIYVGSAFSGSFAGYLSDRFGWEAVFVSWAAACLAGTGMMAAARRLARRNSEEV